MEIFNKKSNAPALRNSVFDWMSKPMLFNAVWEDFFNQPRNFAERVANFVPAIDVAEKEDGLLITAELPGLEDKDVEVFLDSDVLTIKGHKSQKREEKDAKRTYFESSYGSFARSVRLPYEVDPERVEAKLKQGILSVTLQKTPESNSRSRRIQLT